MSGQSFQIEYGPSAVADLDALPTRERAQILRKIARLEAGLHGDIKRLHDTESCSMWKMPLLSSAGLATAKMFMTRTVGKDLIRSIDRKREQIATLREELETMNDYLDLTEARVRDEGKPRLSHAEVKKRYGLK
jgi:hypothetical protein